MDKIANYQQVLKAVITQYGSIKKSLTPGVKSQTIIDSDNHHYQLLSIGWHNHRFVYAVILHFDIIGEKVWIQQNNTDVLIADELISRGITKTDIVLGFVSEQARSRMALTEN
ncbi:MAG: XisI protein [Bacteroidetes bacterium]|nr:XisI protein [Fibrella sp.]